MTTSPVITPKIEAVLLIKKQLDNAVRSIVDTICDPISPITLIGDLRGMGHTADAIKAAIKVGAITVENGHAKLANRNWRKNYFDSIPNTKEAQPVGKPNSELVGDFAPAILNGLKLKNEDRASKDGYWLYVGSKDDCVKALSLLSKFGVEAYPGHNGNTGCWKLTYNTTEPGGLINLIGSPIEKIIAHFNLFTNESQFVGVIDDCLLAARILWASKRNAKVMAEPGQELAKLVVY